MEQKMHVTLCELNYFPNMLPLVSGYLQSYAQRDENINKSIDFEFYTGITSIPSKQLLKELVAKKSDIYAFSCYIWNMGKIKNILLKLIDEVPDAKIILGGPQVQGRVSEYIPSKFENVFVANGEGEVIFLEFLKEVIAGTDDYSNCPGLNYWKDDEVITTESPPLISDLNSIPSPFLNGIFDDLSFLNVSYETNRGCPYTCAFCYFSRGGEYRKIRKFSRERIEKEMEWLVDKNLMYLFLADANWGVFPQDIEISKYISTLSKKTGSPMFVQFSSAKNKPNNVLEIAKAFKEAGISASQPVSFQSLDEGVLELISRKNIKQNKIDELQQQLDSHKIDSYVEMIWPLPGETLETFSRGLDELCDKKIGNITCYPLLLLPNTALWNQQEEHGLETITADDEVSETKIVIKTKWVTQENFEEGVRVYFAAHVLYNLSTLRTVSDYIKDRYDIRRTELFKLFIEYWKDSREHLFSQWVEDYAIGKLGFFDNGSLGLCANIILYEERNSYFQYLKKFVSQLPYWDDSNVRILFEIDVLNTPYLFSTTPKVNQKEFEKIFSHVQLLEYENNIRTIKIPYDSTELIRSSIERQIVNSENVDGLTLYKINYVNKQLPHIPTWGNEQIGSYGQGAVQSSRSFLPRWKAIQQM